MPSRWYALSFCSTVLRLSISTLFPYTTLFRSPGSLDFLQSVVTNDVAKLVPNKAQYTFMCYENGGIVDEDRKSTRLNSSHVAISYAVFCLKKKTLICK